MEPWETSMVVSLFQEDLVPLDLPQILMEHSLREKDKKEDLEHSDYLPISMEPSLKEDLEMVLVLILVEGEDLVHYQTLMELYLISMEVSH